MCKARGAAVNLNETALPKSFHFYLAPELDMGKSLFLHPGKIKIFVKSI